VRFTLEVALDVIDDRNVNAPSRPFELEPELFLRVAPTTLIYRSDLNAVRSSSTKTLGCSQAAK
jgi:hypothetical protein